MRSVTVRLRAAEFPTRMKIISDWLSANRYEPMRYKYDHRDDDVLVTIDFPGEAAAKVFAARFGGVQRPPLQPISSDSSRQWAT
jgi:hypothetical protein